MPTNQTLSIQKTIQLEKYKCSVEPMYFFKRYIYIQDANPLVGRTLFSLYPFQADTLKDFTENRFNIVLKSRQMGISTLIAAYSLWMIMFHSDKKILIASMTLNISKNMLEKIKFAYDGLPLWMKSTVKVVVENKTEIALSNGSKVKCVSGNPDAARSEGLSLLILDEAAFIKQAEDMWAAAAPTLSTGGSAIILSTPNSAGNWFHGLWQDAESGKPFNDEGLKWKPIRLPWNLHPDRKKKWRDSMDAQLGKLKAAQECDCSFLSSGNTVIEGEVLEVIKQKHVKEPIEKRGKNQDTWIWDYSVPNIEYLISADVARGTGGDNSGAHVIDLLNMVQVAEIQCQSSPREFARQLYSLGIEYNTALISVENASIGWDVISELIEMGYPNIYYSKKDEGFVDVARSISNSSHIIDKMKDTPGFTTSTKTRPLMIQALQESFILGGVIYRSIRLHNELETFIWLNNKAQGAPGKKDDLVLAWAQGLYLLSHALRVKNLGEKFDRAIVNGFSRNGGNLNTPAAIYMNREKFNNPWEQQTQHGALDLKWLL